MMGVGAARTEVRLEPRVRIVRVENFMVRIWKLWCSVWGV